jgi:hypothetical protein
MTPKINSYFVSGAKFCRPCGLGFAADINLTRSNAVTLGLIISESINGIYVPVFKNAFESLGIKDKQDWISLADLGCLVHAQVSKENGTQILYFLPNWLEKFRDGIEFSFMVQLSHAMNVFISEVENAPWIFPITTNNVEFKKFVESHIGIELNYTNSWISSDAYLKLKRFSIEYSNADENIRSKFLDAYFLAKQLIGDFERFGDLNSNLLDVNDGSIIKHIGKKAA